MKPKSGLFAFVVQKHKATSLHYDFRLEIGGEMPSWSVPKGPSLDPRVKRLAMPTGPHDMEYRHFEGVIPRGNYGAGTVMIWDKGTYSPEVEASKVARRQVADEAEGREVMEAGMRDGNLKFELFGSRLQGSFALVRMRGFGSGKRAWLLIKHRDAYCKEGYDANDYYYSAETNRSLSEIFEKESTG